MLSRAVIFDLDGTLLDTLEDFGNAANQVLAEKGFAVHPVNSYRQLIGEGVSQLIMRALPSMTVRVTINGSKLRNPLFKFEKIELFSQGKQSAIAGNELSNPGVPIIFRLTISCSFT